MDTELFDRYVREVGRRLPKKQRADVEAELHSLLMDALQDRAPAGAPAEISAGEAETEEAQVAILEEFGPPAQVAAQYTPSHHYLIGPRIFNLYLIVVAAVAGALTVAHVVLLVLAVWGKTASLAELGAAFLDVFDGYLGALLAGYGSVTLTFAILERVLPESALEELGEEEAWDPRSLPPVEDRARIELGSVIVEIVFCVLALILFNFFPQWVGVSYRSSVDGAASAWHSMPLLAPVFFEVYLPWLNVTWIAQIVLNVVLLRQGRWRIATRIVDLLLTAFGGFILARMVLGPPLLTMEAVQPDSLRQTLETILLPLLRLALVLGLVGTVVEVVQKVIRLFRTGTTSAYGRVADEGAGR
jgi:hypothetical protein